MKSNVGFWWEGKTGVPGEEPWSREPTNSIHIVTPSSEMEPGPHWWKASALTTRPTQLPCFCIICIVKWSQISHLWYAFVIKKNSLLIILLSSTWWPALSWPDILAGKALHWTRSQGQILFRSGFCRPLCILSNTHNCNDYNTFSFYCCCCRMPLICSWVIMWWIPMKESLNHHLWKVKGIGDSYL